MLLDLLLHLHLSETNNITTTTMINHTKKFHRVEDDHIERKRESTIAVVFLGEKRG